MESVSCDLCGKDEGEIIFTGPGWQQPVPEGFSLVRCRNCGLIYLNPRPRPDEIGDYYPSDYNPYRPAVEDESSRLMRYFRRRKLIQRRMVIEKFSGLRSGRILDVGCSTGLFLNEMQLSGWQTYGVEPIPSAAEYSRSRFGLNVFNGQLADSPFPLQSFDVITFWDVLEHTFSPTTELRRASELLKPNGLLAINIPNYDSPDRQLFGPNWIGYDPPRHLYVFTQTTLTALLKKTEFQPIQWLCFISSYFPFILSLSQWLQLQAPKYGKPVQFLLNIPGVRFIFEPYFMFMNWRMRGSVISVFARK